MSSLRAGIKPSLSLQGVRRRGNPAKTKTGLLRFARNDGHHHHARLRAGAFLAGAAAFFAGAFLAVGFLAPLLSFAPPPSPRLFLSAAIKSMTLEPRDGGASASGSWMTFSPFLRCFSAIRLFSAST